MNKIKIILTLIRWLYCEPHPNGVRHTINRQGKGTWFLVEPAYIYLSNEQATKDVVEIDGKCYVRVGGGKSADQYIFIGNAGDVRKSARFCQMVGRGNRIVDTQPEITNLSESK